MTGEQPNDGDLVLRRVAAVRPPIHEDDLAPDGQRAQEILERVLASSPAAPSPTPSPGPASRSRGRWVRPQWALPRLGLALAPVAAAIVLLLAGTFSGPGSSGTQPAAADVIRATIHALASAGGTIFVEDQTYVSGPAVNGHPYTFHDVLETPAGPGPQNELKTTGMRGGLLPGSRPTLTGDSYVGGTEEIYSPKTNTIYVSSIWGPYLHPGRRPGTFVYRYGIGSPMSTTPPVNVTARQRRALLTGRAAIAETSKLVGSKVKLTGVKVITPLRAPGTESQLLQEQLKNHVVHYVGRTTVDGRAALELAVNTAGLKDSGDPTGEYTYLDPTTHLPFEEIDGPGSAHEQVIHLHLLKLAITPATQRQLSLQALYPSARVDHSHRDYVRAGHGLSPYPQ